MLSQGECVPEDRGEDELLSAVGGEVFVIVKYLCVFQVLACAFVGEIDRGGRRGGINYAATKVNETKSCIAIGNTQLTQNVSYKCNL